MSFPVQFEGIFLDILTLAREALQVLLGVWVVVDDLPPISAVANPTWDWT